MSWSWFWPRCLGLFHMLLLLSLKFHFVSCTRLDKAFFQLLLLFCSVSVSAFCLLLLLLLRLELQLLSVVRWCCLSVFLLFMRRRFAFVMKVAGLLLFLLPTTIFPIVCVCPSENLHKHQFVFECVHEFLHQTVFYYFQFFRSSPDSTGLTACTSGWVCVSVWDPHSSIPTNSHIVDME